VGRSPFQRDRTLRDLGITGRIPLTTPPSTLPGQRLIPGETGFACLLRFYFPFGSGLGEDRNAKTPTQETNRTTGLSRWKCSARRAELARQRMFPPTAECSRDRVARVRESRRIPKGISKYPLSYQ